MPTIKGIPGPYRFYFYSFDCAEPIHVHVQRERMVCKFWVDPIMLADNNGFPSRELRKIHQLIETYADSIMEAWDEHCGQNSGED